MSRGFIQLERRRRTGGGFTLIEVVLVLSLMVMLAGVSILNWSGMLSREVLEEGASRMETALRMARAEAANLGRRFQIVFDADGQTLVYWEQEPLAKPGVFTEYTACTWKGFLASEDVRVSRCEYTGSSGYRMAEADTATTAAPDTSALVPITFEPDGSSDSVVIEIVAADASEARRAVVELDGLTGTITTSMVTVSATGA